MPSSLSASRIKDTFLQLLHISGGVEGSEKTVYGGTGTATALKVGTGSASVDNIRIDGNTISSTDTNGDINLTPSGTGRTVTTKPFGYTTGAGGAVSQATSKSTGVSLSALCGVITMNNAALASGAAVSFTLTNVYIASTDVIIANIGSGATAGAYSLTVDAIGTGSCQMSLRNNSGGSLGEAVAINFALIKGVNA